MKQIYTILAALLREGGLLNENDYSKQNENALLTDLIYAPDCQLKLQNTFDLFYWPRKDV